MTSFGSAVDSQLAAMKASLVSECEKVATKREQSLKDEIEKLRKEIATLRNGEVDSPRTAQPPVSSQDAEVVLQGRLEPSPELSAETGLGGLPLDEGFWKRGEGTPGSDGTFQTASDVIQTASSTQLIESSHWWLINPTGSWKLTWDVIGIPILAWDLITIPMQVFGIEDAPAMIAMGWVTLIFWTLDVPICFVTGYFSKEGDLIMNWYLIMKHYLKGMFSLDMLIIGSDWVSIALDSVEGGAPGFLSNMAMLRALRITRFARLMRLRKLKAKWQTIEDHINSEWCLVCIGLFNKVMTIVALTHYVGCLFFWIGDQSVPGYDSWLVTPYFQYKAEGRVQTTLGDAPWGYQYWTTLHWAITQFTPGGMHVQPQNIPERAFTIFCLLFGMVVFSSFIANVTQARIQLNKMMSRFEKDLWLLRKFCRQNKVSQQLIIRIKRYCDLVLIPKFQHMSDKDVILLPLLSEHLREELHTELMSQKLSIHPFFQELGKNKSAITKICNTALHNIQVARGDVVFGPALSANFMYIITGGNLSYIPHSSEHNACNLEEGRWICEAALWTKWITQGQLQGEVESTALSVNGRNFRTTMAQNALHAQFARNYAKGFLDRMNRAWEHDGLPTDMQESYATRDAHLQSRSIFASLSATPQPTAQNNDVQSDVCLSPPTQKEPRSFMIMPPTPETVVSIDNADGARIGKTSSPAPL